MYVPCVRALCETQCGMQRVCSPPTICMKNMISRANVLFYMRKAKSRSQTLTHTYISHHSTTFSPQIMWQIFFPVRTTHKHAHTRMNKKQIRTNNTHSLHRCPTWGHRVGRHNKYPGANVSMCETTQVLKKKQSPKDQGIHHTGEQRRNPRLQ